MKIVVSEIPPEGLTLCTTISNSEIDLEGIDGKISGNIHFSGSIQKFKSGCILTGHCKAEWSLSCARCLGIFTKPVSENFRIHLSRDPKTEKEPPVEIEKNGNLEECELIGDEIDLTSFIREQLILELPIKPICSEGCRGLCPQCGQNLNEGDCACEKTPLEPRFFKLRKLFEK